MSSNGKLVNRILPFLMLPMTNKLFLYAIRVRGHCWHIIPVVSMTSMRSHPTCWKWYELTCSFLERSVTSILSKIVRNLNLVIQTFSEGFPVVKTGR